jgi:hypothetical protein
MLLWDYFFCLSKFNCNALILSVKNAVMVNYRVKHVSNGTSRVQNIFLLKPGFRLMKVCYNN